MSIYTLEQCQRLAALYREQSKILLDAGNTQEATEALISELWFLDQAAKIIAENQQGRLPL